MFKSTNELIPETMAYLGNLSSRNEAMNISGKRIKSKTVGLKKLNLFSGLGDANAVLKKNIRRDKK